MKPASNDNRPDLETLRRQHPNLGDDELLTLLATKRTSEDQEFERKLAAAKLPKDDDPKGAA